MRTAEACRAWRGDWERVFEDERDALAARALGLPRPSPEGGDAFRASFATATTGATVFLATLAPTPAVAPASNAAAASFFRIALPPWCVSTWFTSLKTSGRRRPHSGHVSCGGVGGVVASESIPAGTTAPAPVSSAPRALCPLRMLRLLCSDEGPGRLHDS